MECADTTLTAAMRHWSNGMVLEAETSVEAALAQLATQGAAMEDVACVRNDWADFRFSQGAYDELTLSHYQRAYDALVAASGPGHPDVANLLNNLAALALARGRHVEAEAHARLARSIVEAVLGQADEGSLALDADVEAAIRLIHLNALRSLATALRCEGHYPESECAGLAALRIAQDRLARSDAQIATCQIQLGVLYKYAGRYEEAQERYMRALAILDDSSGSGTEDLADLLYNLGGLAHAKGRHAEAEAFARRALTLDLRLHHDTHPSIGIKEGALALFLAEQGKCQAAESICRHALTILEAGLGRRHPDVALTMSNLASIVAAQGRAAEAESLYRCALATREALLGATHPQVGLNLNNLAALLRDEGRYTEARVCYDRALGVLQACCGPEHPHTVVCAAGRANLLQQMGCAVLSLPMSSADQARLA